MKDLVNYLRENIDSSASIETEANMKLPLFMMDAFELFRLSIIDHTYLLLKPRGESLDIKLIDKTIDRLERDSDYLVVVCLDDITTYIRKRFIKNRVAFLVNGGQMFIPSLGLDLMRRHKAHRKQSEQFKPIEQLTFLYILYNNIKTIQAEDLSVKLDISYQHAGRALSSLADRELLVYSIAGKTGRTKIYHQRETLKEFYNRGKTLIADPVIKKVYLNYVGSEEPLAGVNALARVSMLAEEERDTRAISQKALRGLKDHMLDMRVSDEEVYAFQVWAYEPKLLANRGCVDPVSLMASFSVNSDPRIEEAIEDLMEDAKWLRG